MIIELDNSIKDIKKDDVNQDIIESLNMLANIRKYGKHYVLAKIPVLNHIEQLCNNDSTRDIFRYIKYSNEIVQNSQQLLNQVTYKVLISTFKTTFEIEESDGIKIYHIPLTEFHKLFDLKETSFRSENIRDCKFYEHITNWFLDLKKKNIKLNYTFKGVEWQDIEDELNRKEGKTFCLIIVDSDKKYPDDEYGNTLKNCRKVYERFKNNTVSELFYFEEIHEKENLILPSIYKELFYEIFCREDDDYKDHRNNLNNLIRVEKDYPEYHEKLQYFDFKNGIDLSNGNINDNIKEYFKPMLDKLNVEKIGKVFNKSKMNNGLNDKLKNYFETHSKEKHFDELPDYIKKSWGLLSITVFSWCCSPDRIPIE